jgi:hypothetical protein
MASIDLKKLAEILHGKFCRYEHEERCDFYYDNGSWSRRSRKKWLEVAKAISHLYGLNEVRRIISDYKKLSGQVENFRRKVGI